MILMNAAYVPYYFNNEQIKAIQLEVKEDGVNILHVYLLDGLSFSIFCDQSMSQRNWKEIVSWDKYRFGGPEDDTIRSYGSRSYDSADEEMHHNTTIYPQLVPDSGAEDGETPGGME